MANRTAEPAPPQMPSETDKIPKDSSPDRTNHDLNSGMELLELDFLLSIVEQTGGEDKNDVTMRRLTFDELLRRNNQDRIDSKALSVYAVNKNDLYGKNIQCQAIKELTKRTVGGNKLK